MNNKKMFTLLEMIVTFVMLALIVTIAVRNYTFEKDNTIDKNSESLLRSLYIEQEQNYIKFGRYIDDIDIITKNKGYISSINQEEIIVTNSSASDNQISIKSIGSDKIYIAYNKNGKCYELIGEPKNTNVKISVYSSDSIDCRSGGI